MSRRQRIVIFTRFPRPGTTKTRMIPVLGPKGAADLQRRMTEWIVNQARELAQQRAVAVTIAYTDGSREEMETWLGGPGLLLQAQGPGDIGQRMDQALAAGFRGTDDRIVLVGSDIPGVTALLLSRALDCLDDRDLVIGPAADGGYYLLGLTASAYQRSAGQLFAGVPWSSERVFAETMARIAQIGLSHRCLPRLHDVDRPGDLIHLDPAFRCLPG